MKQKLKQNLDLKVLAILFSVIIWVVVVNIDDPVKSVQFNDVPVQLSNEKVLKDKNLVYEVIDDVKSVDVTVSGRRSVIEELSKEDISVVADFREMDEHDRVPLKLSTSKHSNEIDSIKSATEMLDLEIEQLGKIQKVIQVETVGTPSSGYIIGDHTINLNQVHIEGPKSIVDSIDRAIVQVDVEGVVNNVSASAPILLFDKNNEVVDTSRIDMNIETISVTQEILFTKSVPINCLVSGTPAEGYRATGKIEISPSEVTICGKKSSLDAISQITVPANLIDITDCESDFVTSVNVSNLLPFGVETADSGLVSNVKIVVYIEEEASETYSLATSKIEINNAPEKTKVEIVNDAENVMSNRVEVTVKGIETDLEDMSASLIEAYVDIDEYMESRNLTKLNDGYYTVPLTIDVPEGLHVDDEIRIRVRITNIS